MPFRHVVMFKWNEGLGQQHVDRVREGLNALPSAIDSIRSYLHGTDIGISDDNYDYVVVADFDNIDGWRTYRDHPQHLLFIEEVIKGNVAQRAAVQYITGPS